MKYRDPEFPVHGITIPIDSIEDKKSCGTMTDMLRARAEQRRKKNFPPHIDIDGKLVRKCFAELKLSEIKLKIKELNNAIDEFEKLLADYEPDIDACVDSIRRLG